MKKFFKLWYLLSPASQSRSLMLYAENLQEAREKAVKRLKKDYNRNEASLCQQFQEFADGGAAENKGSFCCELFDLLSPEDITAYLADLEKATPKVFVEQKSTPQSLIQRGRARLTSLEIREQARAVPQSR